MSRSPRRGFWQTAKELVAGKQGGVGVVGGGFHRRTKRIKPTFEEMIGRYLAEGRIKTAIDEIAGSTTGMGSYTTCNEGYDDAKAAVDAFSEEIDLDTLSFIQSKDLWACGNTVFKYVYDKKKLVDILRVPISTIKRLKADLRTGRILEIEQRIRTEAPYVIRGRELEFVRCWVWNPIDTGVIGRGLMEPYVRDGYGYEWKDSGGKWHKSYRPSLAKINEEIEDYMRVAIIRFAPKLLMKLAGFTDKQAAALKDDMKDLSWVDDLVVWYGDKESQDLIAETIHTDPRSRMHPHIQHFIDKELIAMETPSVKLLSETGFTEASSRTAERVGMRIIMPMQRFHKRRIERDIHRRIITQELNYGPTQLRAANVRLHFNLRNRPDITFKDLYDMRMVKSLSLVEHRKNLAKLGIELTQEGLNELIEESQLAKLKEEKKVEQSS